MVKIEGIDNGTMDFIRNLLIPADDTPIEREIYSRKHRYVSIELLKPMHKRHEDRQVFWLQSDEYITIFHVFDEEATVFMTNLLRGLFPDGAL